MLSRKIRCPILMIIISILNPAGANARVDNKIFKTDDSQKKIAKHIPHFDARKKQSSFLHSNWKMVARLGHKVGYVQEIHIGCIKNNRLQKNSGIIIHSLFDRTYCTASFSCFSSLQAAASTICTSSLQKSTSGSLRK